jgi:hypothetical protein
LDRVAEDVNGHLRPHGERELADPLARLRADGGGADQHAAAGIGVQLQDPRSLRVLERPRARDGLELPGGRGGVLPGGVAHRRHLGIGEDGGGNRAVVGAGVQPGDVRRCDPPLVLADVREERDAGDVAGRPHAVAGAEPLVHDDPLPLDGHVELLEPEALHPGLAARGDEESLGLYGGLPLELEAELGVAAALDARRLGAQAELDPLLPERLRQDLPGVRVVAGEQVRAVLHERHARAQARVELRELAADGAAAHDGHALGHGARARRIAAMPVVGLGQALDRRGDRERARGDDEVVVGQLAPVHADQPRLGDDAGAADELGALLAHPVGLARVVLLGDLVPPLEDARGVDGRHRLGGARREPGAREHLERAQQRLRGDAGPVGALPADELVLDDDDIGVGREPAQRGQEGLARRPRPQHDDLHR